MPPPQRRAADEISLGELGRLIESLTGTVQEMRSEVRGLSQVYTPREVHDLALGGVKIDIRRLDEELSDVKRKSDQIDTEINRRFRQNVTLTISVLLAPLTIALVVFLLTRTAQ